MDIFKISMLSVVVLTVIALIKQYRADFVPFARVAATLLFAGAIILASLPLYTYLKKLISSSPLSEYGEIILKALSVAFLTEVCADLCRDAGEASLASWVEIAGRIEILLLSLSVIVRIYEMIVEMVG